MSLFMTRTYDKCTTPSQYMRYWREKAGLSRLKLALAADVRQETIERWEKGETGPTVELAWCVADVLGVSIDAYVGRVRVDTEGP